MIHFRGTDNRDGSVGEVSTALEEQKIVVSCLATLEKSMASAMRLKMQSNRFRPIPFSSPTKLQQFL